jgi:hypothetical protein
MKPFLIILFTIQFNYLFAQSVNFKGQQVTQSDICNSLGFKDNLYALFRTSILVIEHFDEQ